MKRGYIYLVIIILLLIPVLMAIADSDHDHHDHDHSSLKQEHNDTAHAKTPIELFTDLEALVVTSEQAVSAKEFAKIHDLTEDITHIVEHIAEKVSEDKKARVSGSSKNIIAIANSLHIAADKGEELESTAHLNKLKTMLTVLRAQLS